MEIGRRLTDPTHELVQLIARLPLCQIYELDNTPESVECGDLGTLTTGGKRYASFYSKNSIQMAHSMSVTVQNLRHAIEPLWQLDYITDADFNEDTNAPDVHQWVYQADSNFQAFQICSVLFTLSMTNEPFVYSQSDAPFDLGSMPLVTHCESPVQSRSNAYLDRHL